MKVLRKSGLPLLLLVFLSLGAAACSPGAGTSNENSSGPQPEITPPKPEDEPKQIVLREFAQAKIDANDLLLSGHKFLSAGNYDETFVRSLGELIQHSRITQFFPKLHRSYVHLSIRDQFQTTEVFSVVQFLSYTKNKRDQIYYLVTELNKDSAKPLVRSIGLYASAKGLQGLLNPIFDELKAGTALKLIEFTVATDPLSYAATQLQKRDDFSPAELYSLSSFAIEKGGIDERNMALAALKKHHTIITAKNDHDTQNYQTDLMNLLAESCGSETDLLNDVSKALVGSNNKKVQVNAAILQSNLGDTSDETATILRDFLKEKDPYGIYGDDLKKLKLDALNALAALYDNNLVGLDSSVFIEATKEENLRMPSLRIIGKFKADAASTSALLQSLRGIASGFNPGNETVVVVMEGLKGRHLTDDQVKYLSGILSNGVGSDIKLLAVRAFSVTSSDTHKAALTAARAEHETLSEKVTQAIDAVLATLP